MTEATLDTLSCRRWLIAVALLLTSCASYHPPPPGSWGYRGTLKSGVSAVAYAPSLAMCNTIREKDVTTVNPADWAAGGISECAPLTVTLGAGWFAFSIVDVSGIGMATTDETACALLRQQYIARIPLVNRPVGSGSWMYVPAYKVTKCAGVRVTGP
jgi:hypothetical protein